MDEAEDGQFEDPAGLALAADSSLADTGANEQLLITVSIGLVAVGLALVKRAYPQRSPKH
jgi:hypothetical protein